MEKENLVQRQNSMGRTVCVVVGDMTVFNQRVEDPNKKAKTVPEGMADRYNGGCRQCASWAPADIAPRSIEIYIEQVVGMVTDLVKVQWIKTVHTSEAVKELAPSKTRIAH